MMKPLKSTDAIGELLALGFFLWVMAGILVWLGC